MSNWFYYNQSGERIGPVTTATLKLLCQQGVVTSETVIENTGGRTIVAGKVRGLEFPTLLRASKMVVAPPESSEVYGVASPGSRTTPFAEPKKPRAVSHAAPENPFTLPDNPFVGPPFLEPTPDDDASDKKGGGLLKAFAWLVGGCLALFIVFVIIMHVQPTQEKSAGNTPSSSKEFSISSIFLSPSILEAKKQEATIFIMSMKSPLNYFELDHGRYPATMEGLGALVEPPDGVDVSKGSWPYIDSNTLKSDPWGVPYQYMCPGQHNPDSYDLWSLGPDGIPNSGDEIGNW